ncbi:MAG: FAD-binding oxidoreductase [Myxococcota bacterium]|nr:FAD-binding oxidoreductase [Myxococcota bacterium]
MAELEALAGVGLRSADPPPVLAGSSLGFEVEPESGEVLSQVMKILSAQAEPVLITGGATKLESINTVRDTRIRLSCAAISGIDECDAADGVMRARAGTPIEDLIRVADEAGWMLPLEGRSPGATLGGTLATAVSGPRRLGFGAVRDNVLGIETTLATGERVRCGARVVKNVTGYDMAKLYIGSFGTLGVIEGAWLRLHPKVESVTPLALSLDGGESSFRLALEAARRTSTRAVVLLPESLAEKVSALGPPPKPGAPWRLLVECAGDETVTRYDAEWLADQATSQGLSSQAIDALEALHRASSAEGLRVRLHLLPSGLEAACGLLSEAGFEVLAYPEPTTVYAFYNPESEGRAKALPDPLAVIESVAARVQANWVIESLPVSGAGDQDRFRGNASLPLMRVLKTEFDPDSILNRGCFVGMI